MQITDPIADMLTRIRNANSAKHDTVEVPSSNMKKSIAEILQTEGYIKNYQVMEDDKQGMIKITLKYGPNKSSVITGLRRVSKPAVRRNSSNEPPSLAASFGVSTMTISRMIFSLSMPRVSSPWMLKFSSSSAPSNSCWMN